MSKPIDTLKSLVGGRVLNASVGHGTFLTLDVERSAPIGGMARIWIYLCDWALLHDDHEVFSSDMDQKCFLKNAFQMENIVNSLVKYVLRISNEEIHFAFTGQYRLEVWQELYKYPDGPPLARIFVNEKHIADLNVQDLKAWG